MTTFKEFKSLHNQKKPLTIGNVWDVQSAKVYEKLHFKAIGTSSAAIAHSLGYEDGENIPFSHLLYIVERISQCCKLPLTVDIESGYSEHVDEIIENISHLAHFGVVGINIEDSIVANGKRTLKNGTEFAHQLQKIKLELTKKNISIFMNVRCDAYLLNVPNAQEETMTRVQLYDASGADGIFVPGVVEEDIILKLVHKTSLPLNIMCMPDLPDFAKLEKMGVRRISMGNFANNNLYEHFESEMNRIVKYQSFETLFDHAIN